MLLRCATGLGAGNKSSIELGGWYFNDKQIPVGKSCQSTFQVRQASGRLYPGVINLYPCRTELLLTEEGVYLCNIRNSSMINQTMRVGLYLGGRSKLHDEWLLLLTILSLYIAAPCIDPPSTSDVTIIVGYPLTLSCTSRGSPPDTFTWMKDGVPITQSTSFRIETYTNTSAVYRSDYIINAVSSSDIGSYTCTVINPIGSDNETITVTGKYCGLLFLLL